MRYDVQPKLTEITQLRDDSAALVRSPPPALRPVDIETFLRTEFPPRQTLLSPWLPVGGLAMLFASRGVGKTHVALGVAYAVASGGSFMKWQAPEPRKVLIIDGEMPAVTLQERLARIARDSLTEPPDASYLRILASDLARDGLPDLSSPDEQARYAEAVRDAALIVVDNVSTLCRSGRENESEGWAHSQGWALQQRREGRSVLFIHHAGKGGQQRGTSRREDVLDTVVNLKRPEDYSPSQGARFEVHFEKARGFTGLDAEPFEATLTEAGWALRNIENALEDRIALLDAEGFKQREIATEVGISAATVNRILKRMREGA